MSDLPIIKFSRKLSRRYWIAWGSSIGTASAPRPRPWSRLSIAWM